MQMKLSAPTLSATRPSLAVARPVAARVVPRAHKEKAEAITGVVFQPFQEVRARGLVVVVERRRERSTWVGGKGPSSPAAEMMNG